MWTQYKLGSVIRRSSFALNNTVVPNIVSSHSARFRFVLRVAMIGYAVFIVWQSLLPAGTGGAIPHMDKVLHAIVYGILAGGMALAWPKLSKIYILIGCIVLGGVLEITQGVMSLGRTASVWDGFANAFGAALAIAIVIFITRKFAP